MYAAFIAALHFWILILHTKHGQPGSILSMTLNKMESTTLPSAAGLVIQARELKPLKIGCWETIVNQKGLVVSTLLPL